MTRFCLLCVLAFGLTYSAHARIGETVDAIEVRYGKPIPGSLKNPVKHSKNYSAMGAPDSITSAKYLFNGFAIHVEFTNGRSVKETFTKDELDSSDIDALLKANSDNKKWTPIAPEATDKGVTHWKREDGVTAFFYPSPHSQKPPSSLTIACATTGF